MVFLRQSPRPHSAFYPDLVQKEYWKLEAEDIEGARAGRGFLDYDQCTLDDLLQFCKRRGLALPPAQDATFSRLEGALQEADEVGTFNGFLDLPPELRLRIYEFYKLSLDFDHSSVAPPVTAVSKRVRLESTSVFFRERFFTIHREPPQGDVGLQIVTSLFFDQAPRSLSSLCGDSRSRRHSVAALATLNSKSIWRPEGEKGEHSSCRWVHSRGRPGACAVTR